MRVARLRISPVKGFHQAEVDALELTAAGIHGDRRFLCTDGELRRLYSLDLGPLARARAAWHEDEGTLAVRLPDGETFSAPVELESEETVLPTTAGHVVGWRVGGPFAERFSAVAGRPLQVFHVGVGDGSPEPITVLGDGSLAQLAGDLGLDGLDPCRFKMSIELAGVPAYAEDGWDGCEVRVGDALLRIGRQVPRCALTTFDPGTGLRDHDTLRVLLRTRGAMETGEPPFGVYATVARAGTVRVGDRVELSA